MTGKSDSVYLGPLSLSAEVGSGACMKNSQTKLLSDKEREIKRERKELQYANKIVEYLEKIRCNIHHYSKLNDKEKKKYEKYDQTILK